METNMLARGFAIGFAVAATVGPICLLCIRRTLAGGVAVGLATGLGAASADAVYGAVAGFGLTAVAQPLVAQAAWLRGAGGLFLVWLGWRTLRSRAVSRAERAAVSGLAGAYASTLALTLANPVTILSFAAIFAGLGAGGSGFAGALSLVVGVFAGSAGWWLVLAAALGCSRRPVSQRVLAGINRGAGLIMVAMGVLALSGRL